MRPILYYIPFNVFTASKGSNLYILLFSNFICPICAIFVEIYPSVKCKVLAALGWIGTMCIYGSILFIILKELKYATHKSSTVTYAFNILMKSFLEMSCRLHVACDEMRKRHFVDKINVKTSKTMEKSKLLRKRRGEGEYSKYCTCLVI